MLGDDEQLNIGKISSTAFKKLASLSRKKV